MVSQRITQPFEPVVDSDCRILILGSFPSVKSRENGFYYGHPQNRFWRMLAGVYGETLPEGIDEKRHLLLNHGLALWDAIESCVITGSSDASVKEVVPADISRVLSVASISRVICNGHLSGQMYDRYLRETTGIEALVMPSTSPANAAWTLDKLIDTWRSALMMT